MEMELKNLLDMFYATFTDIVTVDMIFLHKVVKFVSSNQMEFSEKLGLLIGRYVLSPRGSCFLC